MITIELLRESGADVQDGLRRCLNDESFYLSLVQMVLEDKTFDQLAKAIEADDKRAAFEAAHALKGVTGNVSLTPLYTEISGMTELLRAGKDADYPAYLARIQELRSMLLSG